MQSLDLEFFYIEYFKRAETREIADNFPEVCSTYERLLEVLHESEVP